MLKSRCDIQSRYDASRPNPVYSVACSPNQRAKQPTLEHTYEEQQLHR